MAPIENLGNDTNPAVALNYSISTLAVVAGQLTLAPTGASAGTYSPASVTLNALGQVTSASVSTPAEIIAALGYTPANNASVVLSLAATAPLYNSGTAALATPHLNYTNSFALTAGQLALSPTGVVANTYSPASVTVNALGQVTAASVSTAADIIAALGYTPAGNGSVVLSLAVSQPIVNTGTTQAPNIGLNYTLSFALSSGQLALAPTGVSPGTYSPSSVSVNSLGQVTAASVSTSADIIAALGYTPAGNGSVVLSLVVSQPVINTGTTQAPNIGLNYTTSFALTSGQLALAATGVSPGTYSPSSVTVNALGQVTAASVSTSADIIAALGYTPAANGSVVLSLAVSQPIINIGTIQAPNIGLTYTLTFTLNSGQLALAPTGVSPGTYSPSSVTVNSLGQVTAASVSTSAAIIAALGYTPAANGSVILSFAVSQPIINTGAAQTPNIGLNYTSTFALASGQLALANSGVTIGTYSPASVTVNAFGQVTAASVSTPAAIIAALGYTPANNGTAVLSLAVSQPITNTGTAQAPNIGLGYTGTFTLSSGQLALATTGVSAGTYSPSSVTVNALGQVTAASISTPAAIIAALGYTPASNSSAVLSLSVSQPIINSGTTQAPNIGLNYTSTFIASTGQLALATTGVSAGTYSPSSITVNALGQVTAASVASSAAIITALGYTPANNASTVNAVAVSAPVTNSGTTLAPNIGLGYTATFTLSTGQLALATTGVSAATYSPSSVTVNSLGQVTAASISTPAAIIAALGYTPANNASTVNSMAVSAPVTNTGTALAPKIGLGYTSTFTLNSGQLALAATGVSAGVYTPARVTVNSQGQVTQASQATSLDITNALGYVPTNAGQFFFGTTRSTGNSTPWSISHGLGVIPTYCGATAAYNSNPPNAQSADWAVVFTITNTVVTGNVLTGVTVIVGGASVQYSSASRTVNVMCHV